MQQLTLSSKQERKVANFLFKLILTLKDTSVNFLRYIDVRNYPCANFPIHIQSFAFETFHVTVSCFFRQLNYGL